MLAEGGRLQAVLAIVVQRLRVEHRIGRPVGEALEHFLGGGEAVLALRRRMQAKLWQALYFKFDYEKEYLPQLEENLVWLGAELQKLTDYQQRRNTYRKK